MNYEIVLSPSSQGKPEMSVLLKSIFQEKHLFTCDDFTGKTSVYVAIEE